MKPEKLTSHLTAIDLPAILDETSYYFKNGEWRSGVNVGVIFEGGALRGVVSAGYGLALAEFIRAASLFSLYGASSGGLNAIYFAAGQLDIALKIYEENATDKQCTNIWRFPNVLNPDWLVDEWMFGSRSFDLNRIKSQAPNIWLTLTDLDTGLPHYFNVKEFDSALIRKAMKATAYAPLVSNGSQNIDGHRYGDGAISDAIAYDKAIADGCTLLVCLLTRPPEYRKKHNAITRSIETLRLLHHTEALREAYFARDLNYSRLLDRLYVSGERTIPTLIVHPADKTEIPGNLETRPEVVGEKGQTAYQQAQKSLWSALSIGGIPSDHVKQLSK